MARVDRAYMEHLGARIEQLRRDYEQLAFHRALDSLLDLCTVDLSAVFLDIAKDRLYTLAPDDPGRRSAQTALWQALHDVTIAVSPALAFTAEEVWQSHPGLVAEAESVHLAEWPRPGDSTTGGEKWAFLLDVRNAVNAAIEPLRAAKQMNTTEEAEVTLHVPPAVARQLEPYGGELASFLLVAGARVVEDPAAAGIRVAAERTRQVKCERCWTYRADVSAGVPRPGLCGRCAAAVEARARAGRA
jgi:isoleucyl-tRNA synthetase